MAALTLLISMVLCAACYLANTEITTSRLKEHLQKGFYQERNHLGKQKAVEALRACQAYIEEKMLVVARKIPDTCTLTIQQVIQIL